MTSRRDGVDATVKRVHWFYLCARRTYNFIFQQSVRIFTAMPKILCACNILSADELTTAKWKTCNGPVLFSFAHVYFSSPELSLGVGAIWAIEPPPIHNSTMFSSHMRFHMITTAVLKGTLETLLTSFYNKSFWTFNKMSIHFVVVRFRIALSTTVSHSFSWQIFK